MLNPLRGLTPPSQIYIGQTAPVWKRVEVSAALAATLVLPKICVRGSVIDYCFKFPAKIGSTK